MVNGPVWPRYVMPERKQKYIDSEMCGTVLGA